MFRYSIKMAATVAAAALMATNGHAAELLGPTAYSSASDSPFNGTSFSQFYLEDFQDGEIDTPGLASSGTGMVINWPAIWSVDSLEFTPLGGVFYNPVGTEGASFTFDAAALGGALPTHAGLVWTDGAGTITFEAFDQNGVSLGTVIGNHDDYRFYGAINEGGISRITIHGQTLGLEVDHVQYGIAATTVAAVPEPATWAMMIAGFGLAGAALRRRKGIPGLA